MYNVVDLVASVHLFVCASNCRADAVNRLLIQEKKTAPPSKVAPFSKTAPGWSRFGSTFFLSVNCYIPIKCISAIHLFISVSCI